MNALSVVKLLPENNEQVIKFSKDITNVIDSGEINPLDVLLCIRGFEKVIKNIKDNLNDLAIDELDKYSEKDIKYKGATLNKVNTGVKYDYSNCGDEEYVSLKTKETTVKNDIKSRETFLKSLTAMTSLNNLDTGEMMEIYPPSKTSTTTAKVILG